MKTNRKSKLARTFFLLVILFFSLALYVPQASAFLPSCDADSPCIESCTYDWYCVATEEVCTYENVTTYIGSRIENNGPAFNLHIDLEVEYFDGASWQLVKQISGTEEQIERSEQKQLPRDWNDIGEWLTSTSTYPSGDYRATVSLTTPTGDVVDNRDGSPATASYPFTISGLANTCSLTQVTTTLNDANINGVADPGETVTLIADFTGDCSAATHLQADLRTADGTTCVVEYTGGDVSGVFANGLSILSTDTSVQADWTVPTVGLQCQGQTVSAYPVATANAALWNGAPGSGAQLSSAQHNGAFTFYQDNGPVCGNGLIEQGESCDDGNRLGGDGCSMFCQLEAGCALSDLSDWSEYQRGCGGTLFQLGGNDYRLDQSTCSERSSLNLQRNDPYEGEFRIELNFSDLSVGPNPINYATTTRQTIPLSLYLTDAQREFVAQVKIFLRPGSGGTTYADALEFGALINANFTAWVACSDDVGCGQTAANGQYKLTEDTWLQQTTPLPAQFTTSTGKLIIQRVNNAGTWELYLSYQDGTGPLQTILKAPGTNADSGTVIEWTDRPLFVSILNEQSLLSFAEQIDILNGGPGFAGDGADSTAEFQYLFTQPGIVCEEDNCTPTNISSWEQAYGQNYACDPFIYEDLGNNMISYEMAACDYFQSYAVRSPAYLQNDFEITFNFSNLTVGGPVINRLVAPFVFRVDGQRTDNTPERLVFEAWKSPTNFFVLATYINDTDYFYDSRSDGDGSTNPTDVTTSMTIPIPAGTNGTVVVTRSGSRFLVDFTDDSGSTTRMIDYADGFTTDTRPEFGVSSGFLDQEWLLPNPPAQLPSYAPSASSVFTFTLATEDYYCEAPVCGDGVLQVGEQCDTGAFTMPNEYCDASCQIPPIGVQGAQFCAYNFVCGEADGICPEDFYDVASGAQVSCSSTLRDPDCLGHDIDIFYGGIATNIISGSEYSNTLGEVELVQQTVQNGNYLASFVIDGPSSATSQTSINFTIVTPPTLVLFDGQPLLACAVSTEPCYTFNNGQLQVYHSLSKHTLDVLFQYQTNWLPYFLLVVMVMLLPIVFIFAKRQQYTRDMNQYYEQIEHRVHVPHSSLAKLHKYIESKMREGIKRERIRISLLNAGWEPHVVDLVMNNHHTPHDDVGRLRIYVHRMKDHGHTNDELKKLLKSRGWKAKVIEEVLK